MTAPVSEAQLNAHNADVPQRGIATLRWGTHVLRFRTNPNECTWTYSLLTHVEQTYGGRVVQILGTKIDDLTVKIECGWGGWPYLMKVVTFMRDLMVAQRNGQPATFEYTTRNWKLNVFAASIPFTDSVSATTRELTLNFKVQQDVTGVVSSASISSTLRGFLNGIGWTKSQYNNPDYQVGINDSGMIPNITNFAGAPLPLVGNNITPVDLGALNNRISSPTITGATITGNTGSLANNTFGGTFGGTNAPGTGFNIP